MWLILVWHKFLSGPLNSVWVCPSPAIKDHKILPLARKALPGMPPTCTRTHTHFHPPSPTSNTRPRSRRKGRALSSGSGGSQG